MCKPPTPPALAALIDGLPFENTMVQIQHALTVQLQAKHGPVLGGVDLARALGYRSSAAMRQARHRGQIALTLFTLPNRRGHYAITSEVAQWLATARTQRALPIIAAKDEGGAP